MEVDFVRSRFIKHFDGKTGNVYASPGRINLIGEHTDYNGGFVFPGAVDKGVMAEMRINGTEDTVMAYAIDLKDRVDFKLSDPNGLRASWARYIYGIALEMKKLGVPVKGFNIAFAGDVPLGAGMSSSAAMESCSSDGWSARVLAYGSLVLLRARWARFADSSAMLVRSHQSRKEAPYAHRHTL